MPDPIPTNRNVRQRQQTQNTPVPPVPRPQHTPMPPARPRLAQPRPQHTPVPSRPRFQSTPARPTGTRRRASTSLRRDPWNHRVAALTVGAVLYGAIDYYSNSLFTQNPSFVNSLWGSVQLGGNTYTLTTGSILIALLFVIPLFFGAAFGPWVGLVVGAIGGLTGDYLASHVFDFLFDWRWGVGMGLIGFFASLAQFRTRRRYSFLAITFIASIVGALAIAIGIGGYAYSINWSLNTAFANSLFIEFAPAALGAIIIFSFLLFVYNAILSGT